LWTLAQFPEFQDEGNDIDAFPRPEDRARAKTHPMVKCYERNYRRGAALGKGTKGIVFLQCPCSLSHILMHQGVSGGSSLFL
jgi:hypothetical protein